MIFNITCRIHHQVNGRKGSLSIRWFSLALKYRRSHLMPSPWSAVMINATIFQLETPVDRGQLGDPEDNPG